MKRRTVILEFDIHESDRSPKDDPDLFKLVDQELYPLWGNITSIMPWSEEIEEHFYGTCTIDLKPPRKIDKAEVVQALIRVTRLLDDGRIPRFSVSYKWILKRDKEANNTWMPLGIASFGEGDNRQPGPPDVPQELSLPPIHSEAASERWRR